jgi:hypothetical protein
MEIFLWLRFFTSPRGGAAADSGSRIRQNSGLMVGRPKFGPRLRMVFHVLRIEKSATALPCREAVAAHMGLFYD